MTLIALLSRMLASDIVRLWKPMQDFVKRQNVIYKRAKLNSRKQQEGEPIHTFITDLYSLAEHCSFRDLCDELIHDRIVVDLRSTVLSEKLQLDPDLTLESALTRMPLNSSRSYTQHTTILTLGLTYWAF